MEEDIHSNPNSMPPQSSNALPVSPQEAHELCGKPLSGQAQLAQEPRVDTHLVAAAPPTATKKRVVRPKTKPEPQQPARDSSVGVAGEQRPVALPKRSAPFAETHKRLTTYIDAGTHAKVRDLYASGAVAHISLLVNATVKDYIQRYYKTSN